MQAIEHVLSCFPDARKSGREWQAHCTAHKDDKASLSIAEGQDGRVVVLCRAGCRTAAVLAPVGLTMSDLFPSSDSSPRTKEPEKIHDYPDEDGVVLYQKVRFPGKEFKQRRPAPAGGWTWSLGDVRRVLYRLPDLLRADATQPVFVVEGEKDVETLERHGLVATTNVEGASKPDQSPKWREEYTQWLRDRLPGRRFPIIPDNDEPGEAHAKHILRSLTAAGLHANLVKLPGLPEKGDVSDWFAAGGSAAKLLELAAPAPARLMLLTFDQVCAMTPPVWQVEQLFEEQTLVEWFGLRGNGKSLVLLDLCLTSCKGTPAPSWCGRKILKTGPVIWINADGGRGVVKRLNAWKDVHGREMRYPFLIVGERDRKGEPRMGRVRLNTPWEIEELLESLAALPEAPAMIVFDTLSRCIPGTDENLQGPMTLVTDQCHRLRAETGCSVHLVHHTDKEGRRQRGSDVVPNEADYVLKVTMDGRNITLSSDKARDGEKFKPFNLELKPVNDSVIVVQPERSRLFGGYEIPEQPEAEPDSRPDPSRELLAFVAALPGSSVVELAAAIEWSESTVRRHLKDLSETGQVRWEKRLPASEGGRPGFVFWIEEG